MGMPWWYAHKFLLIMRITTLLLIATIMQVSAAGFAQKITLKENRISLKNVLKQIKSQTGYDFVYDSKVINDHESVKLDLRNVELEEALKKIFKPLNLKYLIKNKIIFIEKATPTLIDRIISSFSAIDVRGRVLDEQGNPLAGASVAVKGTTKAVITGANGEFLLKNVDESAILVISYIGLESQEIAIKGNTNPIVILKESAAQLALVDVVSTGYQSLPKERATGSFSQIDNKTFNRQVSTDVISRLKGIAPSLYFDERLGNGTMNISIRGQSTIFGSAKPLVVVDNFPFDGNLNNLNPNDVENITILKDAAAASIWGVRAGNGVIVITTKKGRFNQPLKIDFNSNITVGPKPDLFYQPSMNPTDFIDVEKMLFE